jgi:transcriptional regulator with XRE-family HTH domain
MDKPASITSPAVELGRILRTLRKDAKITGAQLGERAGLSQSKISKLEQGYPPLPETETIIKILDILQAPKDVHREVKLLLLKLGAAASSQPIYHFTYLYGRYLELERTAACIQTVTYNVVPALLQTAVYRESLLKAVGLEDSDVRLAMRESSLRQDNIWNNAVTFEFLIHEAALYTMPAGRQAQLAQLDKLERFIGLSNLEIGIIPTRAGLHVMLPCNVLIYDKQTILRSLGTLEQESHDIDTTLQYVQIFEELSLKARFGQEAAKLIGAASEHIAALG